MNITFCLNELDFKKSSGKNEEILKKVGILCLDIEYFA